MEAKRVSTYVPSPSEIKRDWWIVDATGLPLGRLASEVALRLRGKHKPYFTPFLDTGDHVIVINAEKVALSGRKWTQKIYYRHTGHPGGIREITAEKLRATKPERIVELAVKGMLPKNKLGRQMYRKLRVYADGNHQQQAQQPKPLELKA